MIWGWTLPEPRTIKPLSRSHNPEQLQPIALKINRESRAFTRKYYSTWYNPVSVGYHYVDFAFDTIQFQPSDFDPIMRTARVYNGYGHYSFVAYEPVAAVTSYAPWAEEANHVIIMPPVNRFSRVDHGRIQNLQIPFEMGFSQIRRFSSLVHSWIEGWVGSPFDGLKRLEFLLVLRTPQTPRVPRDVQAIQTAIQQTEAKVAELMEYISRERVDMNLSWTTPDLIVRLVEVEGGKLDGSSAL